MCLIKITDKTPTVTEMTAYKVMIKVDKERICSPYYHLIVEYRNFNEWIKNWKTEPVGLPFEDDFYFSGFHCYINLSDAEAEYEYAVDCEANVGITVYTIFEVSLRQITTIGLENANTQTCSALPIVPVAVAQQIKFIKEVTNEPR